MARVGNRARVLVIRVRRETRGPRTEGLRVVSGARTGLGCGQDCMLSKVVVGRIIDRQQVKTDKPTGIINDPKDWDDEHDHHVHRRPVLTSHHGDGGDDEDRRLARKLVSGMDETISVPDRWMPRRAC